MNKIIITGNICHDLEIKTSGETKILNFTVAVKRNFKNKNGEYETDFLRCVAFNNQAEFINKYFQKGYPILIEGNLQTNNYETENGEKRTSFNIVVENINFFSKRKEETSEDAPNPSFEKVMEEKGVDYTIEDDDLPF